MKGEASRLSRIRPTPGSDERAAGLGRVEVEGLPHGEVLGGGEQARLVAHVVGRGVGGEAARVVAHLDDFAAFEREPGPLSPLEQREPHRPGFAKCRHSWQASQNTGIGLCGPRAVRCARESRDPDRKQ